jgi:CRISPR-associated protein Cas1
VAEAVGYYPNNRNLTRIVGQFNWDQSRVEQLWNKIVQAKISNKIAVLNNYQLPNTAVAQKLDQLELNDQTNREAAAARKYFMALFGDDFVRRNYDAINAALDYGHASLLSDFNREIDMAGYLTYLGIYHHSDANECNLASDLMEPFRPFIDYWVKANKNITELTPNIKYGLVELLSLEINFAGKKTLLSNAISKYVRNCLSFLDGKTDQFRIEMGISNEVPSRALNDNVWFAYRNCKPEERMPPV